MKDILNNKLEIDYLTKKIRFLINTSEEQKKKWTKRSSFLFKQIDRLNNLRDFSQNKVLLNAYLIIQNYNYQQKEKITVEYLIDKINKEIDLVDENIEKEDQDELMLLTLNKIKNDELSWECLYKNYFKDLTTEEWEETVKKMDEYNLNRRKLENEFKNYE